MVVGLEGRGQSLVNEISIRAKALRSWFLRSFNVICKLDNFFEITNHLVIPTKFSTKQKTVSRRDKLWFIGVSNVTSCDLLANIGNFHAFAKCIVHDMYTTLKLYNNFCGKCKFQRHEYPLYPKLVSPIKKWVVVPTFDVQTRPDKISQIFYAELYKFQRSKLFLPNCWCGTTSRLARHQVTHNISLIGRSPIFTRR